MDNIFHVLIELISNSDNMMNDIIWQLGSTIQKMNLYMFPQAKDEIDPKVNAIQTLVAKNENAEFKIVLFQHTPAAFHQRPESTSELIKEWKKTCKTGKKVS